MSKPHSISSLPGSPSGYLDSLSRILKYTQHQSPTRGQITDWWNGTFDQPDSEESILQIIRFLQSIELIEKSSGRYKVAERGEVYYREKDPALIFEWIAENNSELVGVLEYLQSGPAPTEKITSEFEEEEREETIKLVLDWLIGLDAIAYNGDRCHLTSVGIDLLEDENGYIATSTDNRRLVTIKVSNSEGMREHYEQTVASDVSAEAVSRVTGDTFDRTDLRIWGNRSTTIADKRVQKGDVLLFYSGQDGYIALAEVLFAEEYNSAQAARLYEEIWPNFVADDPFNYVIYLSNVSKPSIDTDHFFSDAVLDWGDHPNDGWTPLDDYKTQIAATYGSLDTFLSESIEETLYNYWDLKEWPVDTDLAKKVKRQLERKGQVLLYGPPGTGKTYTADTFARWWTGVQDCDVDSEERIEEVTFHPSYSYEDFMEGYSIVTDAKEAGNNGGDVNSAGSFGLKDGVFKEFCEDAQDEYDSWLESGQKGEIPKYVFVIDEVNRGNIAKILGEIIKVTEYSKRGESVKLAHSGQPFQIPRNVYLIATMNTADQSIALVDAAIRRRFAAIAAPPEYSVLYNSCEFPFESRAEALELLETGRVNFDALQAASVLSLEVINRRIVETAGLGKGMRIGHSYLLPGEWDHSEVSRERALVDVWRYDILTLLEEYFFGEFDSMQRLVFGSTDCDLFDQQTEDIADFTVETLRTVLKDLVLTNRDLIQLANNE
ncbi:McrB family protein [Haloprofundus halophilus]|uniref:McrB family protein n=1 Tax=Haloprofundus halophilus TaxID=2283527 RepID=UPI000E43EFEC|nr:AAA family ATPase [Haloprofundus halophilus]